MGRRQIGKKLNVSEQGRGHARERHQSPTLEAGPSIDAYLISRHGARPRVGAKMTAFLNERDQDRAVSFAWNKTDDYSKSESRTTIKSRTSGSVSNITVRVAEAMASGVECYNAQLREVTVVVDNIGVKGKETFVTAYPSDFFRA